MITKRTARRLDQARAEAYQRGYDAALRSVLAADHAYDEAALQVWEAVLLAEHPDE